MERIDFNCIFCAIAAKRAPAALVYEDAATMAFLDIHPITEGHVLVIPKTHCRNLFDFDDANGMAIMHAARVVARALRMTLNADGMNLFQSSERAGGQDVFHFHFHLIPRFQGDGIMAREGHDRWLRWRARATPSHEELDALAVRIRANLPSEPAQAAGG